MIPEFSGPPGSNTTILHLFGLDHHKLSYRFQCLDFRLTVQLRLGFENATQSFVPFKMGSGFSAAGSQVGFSRLNRRRRALILLLAIDSVDVA